MTITTAAMRNLAQRLTERMAELQAHRVADVVIEHRAGVVVNDLRRLADEVDALISEWDRQI
jgi:hypothetical protein